MIISEKQLLVLLEWFKETLNLHMPEGLSIEQRVKIYNQIINQQSDELHEVK